MTEQTPTTRAIRELRAGDAIVIPTRNDDVCEVRDVHIWRAPITAFRLDAAVFVVSLSTGAADTLTGRADQVLALATDEQRAAAVEEHVRRRVVAELQELAAFIERTKPRIVDYFEAPRVSIRLEGGEIERVAEAIGVGTTEYGSGARRAVWPGPDRVGVVSAEFVGVPAPTAPEVAPAEPGSDADRVLTEVLDAAETTTQEHREVNRWNTRCDGRSAGVECACGEKFDELPTIADARKILGHHIAAANAQARTQAGE